MEEEKGASASAATGTVQIDTTGAAKKTPLLKLGRKKLGMNRPTYDDDGNPTTVEETKGPTQPSGITCPFRECGRRFVSDQELKQHMQRRHRPVE